MPAGSASPNAEFARQQDKGRGYQCDHADEVEAVHEGKQLRLCLQLVIGPPVRGAQCIRG